MLCQELTGFVIQVSQFIFRPFFNYPIVDTLKDIATIKFELRIFLTLRVYPPFILLFIAPCMMQSAFNKTKYL